jgi:hypothetical protein
MMDIVKIRFYRNPETSEPHIYDHEVGEDEVEEVLANPGEDLPSRNNSRSIIGRTDAGRYLRVIAVRDAAPGSIFVVTAYELSPRQLAAYRRRRRKRK